MFNGVEPMIKETAQTELERVQSLSEFSVNYYYSRRRYNQHLTRYWFNDGSTLDIFSTSQLGKAYGSDGHKKLSAELNINRQGV